MKELPRYWKYFDIGMMIGSGLIILGVLLILLKAFSNGGSLVERIGVALAFMGILATLWIGHFSTKAIKVELSQYASRA